MNYHLFAQSQKLFCPVKEGTYLKGNNGFILKAGYLIINSACYTAQAKYGHGGRVWPLFWCQNPHLVFFEVL
jgi:hypothetical protein